VNATTPFCPPPPRPEHEVTPAPDLGMLGHTVAGTSPQSSPVGPLPGAAVAPIEPLSIRQSPNACTSESQSGNSTVPESHAGDADSRQRRKPSASVAHDGVIAATAAQFIGHSAPAEQPVCAILPQIAEHEAATWAGEQSPPHRLRGPPPPSEPASVAPPHPAENPNVTHGAK
jgi:hypothetical protein